MTKHMFKLEVTIRENNKIDANFEFEPALKFDDAYEALSEDEQIAQNAVMCAAELVVKGMNP